jgi:hypothetical protein
MAFQSGTKINPALGNADFSGFARAGEIRGQALANFGAQIGQGIEKYKKKKQDAADDAEFAQAVQPYLEEITGGDADEAKKLGKYLRNDIPAFNAINALRKDQVEKEKLEITRNILGQVASGNITPEEAVIAGVDIETLNSFTGIGTQRLEDENIIARTGASRRSNQPTPVTSTQIQGVSKVMDEQFQNVKVDESTGELYSEVPKTGDYNPFNTKRVPANIPESLKSMPGFEEWKKSKLSPSSSVDYGSMGMKVVN